MDAYGTTTPMEVRRARHTELDPTAAIQSYCRWCNAGSLVDGRVDCHSDACPMFEFRPGPWRSETPGAKLTVRRATAAIQRPGRLGKRPRRPLFRVISCQGMPWAGLAVSAPGGPQRNGRVTP